MSEATRPHPGHVLPAHTRLRDYELTSLVGEGGFGIVYSAWDHSLQRRVAIKEYMPASIASRVAGSSAIVVKSERHADTFKAGLKSFVNEARLLARFDHPSLVKVYRFWEEHGTAYMVMPFYEGPTLKAALDALGRPPSEAELRAWLRPLLDALAVIHAAQCYHRDIAPDNILLTPAGPLLLDFGAARRVIGDMTHALTVVLKPGYAPIEQYGDVATMAQGAWTDLYALACVVYFAISGKPPMSSVERLMDDRLEPLSAYAAGRYSPAFLAAIDAALSVRPNDRPQNERAFRALLGPGAAEAETAESRPAPLPMSFAASRPFATTQAMPGSTLPGAAEPVAATELLPKPVASAASGRPRMGLLAAGLVLALLVVTAFVWVLPSGRPPAARVAADTPVHTPAVAAPAPVVVLPAVAPPVEPVIAAPIVPPIVDVPLAASTPAVAAAPLPKAEKVPAPVRREPRIEARIEPRAEPATIAAPRRASGARCSDILQKASLEPLTAEEAAYLKRECR